jgi:uncharacterized protein with NAD-binding domain and iron-sulfur cluster
MNDPIYVQRGGSQVFAPPFVAKSVQFYGFAVKGDRDALQKYVCDRYLNGPGGTTNFVPASSHVLFVFNRLAKLYAKNPPDVNLGWYSEEEAAVWTLVLDKQRELLFWFQPYMIVSNSLAMAMGREIYGFPKAIGWFDVPNGPDAPESMSVETMVAVKLDPASEGQRRQLFAASRANSDGQASQSSKIDSLEHLTREIRERFDLGSLFHDLEIAEHLFKDLIQMRIPMVFLKQFRDGTDPTRACYQCIQETRTKMTRFNDGRLYLNPYRIDLSDYPSHPIRRDIGLPAGPIRSVLSYWVDFDFEIGETSVSYRPSPSVKKEKPRKVVILGGGVSAMATAWQLTEAADWKERFESITVYQLGWRLGGKGASGRGADGRIEEHGLHVWLGFYENSFKIIRQVYEELGRSPGAPLATWQDAFNPHSYLGVNQRFEGDWHPWMFDFPTNDGIPGDGGEFMTPAQYVETLLGWISEFAHKHRDLLASERQEKHEGFLGWLKKGVHHLGIDLDVLKEGVGITAFTALEGLAGAVHDQSQHGRLIELLERILGWLENELIDLADGELIVRRILILLDMAATISIGLLRDGVVTGSKKLDDLDGEDFSGWLKRHHAFDLISNLQTNPLLRGLYDFVFAFENGEIERPNLATPVAIRSIFRMCLTYKGAIFWKMQAGMGDTIFGPLYEVLCRRGVEFRFFHDVKQLKLDSDKKGVAEIEIGRQVTLNKGPGSYNPLVDVNGLPCWPAEPCYDQIAEGDELKRRAIDLESFWTPWKDVAKVTLKAGEDFDVVVFGISLASIPYLCAELVEVSDAWKEMVQQVGTVRTLALQLWPKLTVEQLGWKNPGDDSDNDGDEKKQKRPILDAWQEPLNTWADMTNLLVRETWSGPDAPKSIAYFCGPMKGGIPGRPNPKLPREELDKVEQTVRSMLQSEIQSLWRNVPGSGLPQSDLAGIYYRANIDPSQRYVMSLAGSLKHRLRADQSGFSNLVLTGDWIKNGFNAGCVEASVWAGIQAANTILGRPLDEGVIGGSL